MSFLVAYNGQFTPLQPVQGAKSHVIRPVSPLNRLAETDEFRDILEEVSPPVQHQPIRKKIETYHQSTQNFEREKRRDYARDIMSSPVIVLHENTPAHEAKMLFSKKSFRHLPIVNVENIIVGMLSDRELLNDYTIKTCKDVMVQKVIVCNENTSVHEVAIILLQEKINALPVINREHELIGIITLSDILNYVIKSTGFLSRG